MTTDGMKTIREFKGRCLGIKIIARDDREDYPILITFLVKDDGNWFDLSGDFHSHWLPDFEKQLQQTKDFLSNSEFVEEYKWGYRLTEKGKEVFL